MAEEIRHWQSNDRCVSKTEKWGILCRKCLPNGFTNFFLSLLFFQHDLLFGGSMMEFSWNPQNIFEGKS